MRKGGGEHGTPAVGEWPLRGPPSRTAAGPLETGASKRSGDRQKEGVRLLRATALPLLWGVVGRTWVSPVVRQSCPHWGLTCLESTLAGHLSLCAVSAAGAVRPGS